MPSNDAIIATVLARPDADPAELAALLGLPVAKYITRRYSPAVDTRITAELSRREFAPARRLAVEEMRKSVEVLVALRDDPVNNGRDRATAAKLVVELALKLDERQRQLDDAARLTALVAGITSEPPDGPSVEPLPAEPPPAPPTEHPPVSEYASDVAGRLLSMRPELNTAHEDVP